jgi:hypothetical protein
MLPDSALDAVGVTPGGTDREQSGTMPRPTQPLLHGDLNSDYDTGFHQAQPYLLRLLRQPWAARIGFRATASDRFAVHGV